MKINYPETIVNKSEGTTASEVYLAKLCQNTFLSMWSYPNICRDQGKKNDGKEICDLLVVFQNHVIILSDKKCSFPYSDNLNLDWSRWYRKAIKKSADQIFGAERWLLQYPDRIYLDKSCTKKLPISLPTLENVKIHRIVIAHASSERCIAEIGGSGSLKLIPRIVGDMHCDDGSHHCEPFAVGQIDPNKGYVHVFDDTTIGIVMDTLDTVSDFISYLESKEEFITSGKLNSASGEEDLLAHYLKELDSDGKHGLFVNPNSDSITLSEGLWDNFKNHPQRLAQIEANKISYMWDALIESFLTHLFSGTSRDFTFPSISHSEKALRFLARENRTRRRLLALSLSGLIEKTSKTQRATRTTLPSHEGDPHYLFLIMPRLKAKDEVYRKVRGNLLSKYLMITKLHHPDAVNIIGIATETRFDKLRSEDFSYYDASIWTDDEITQAKEYEKELKEMGLLADKKMSRGKIKEYPDVELPKKKLKGRDRNKPCYSGSGNKYKKCCGD